MIDFEVWEPGNMTRYELAAEKTSNEKVIVLLKRGAHVEGIILSQSIIGGDYIADKTGWRKADVAAILAWVEEKVGMRVRMPTGFNRRGLWEGEDENDNTCQPA